MKKTLPDRHINRQPLSHSHAGERLLITLEKYIGLDIILMMIGLIHKSDGLRGYPFAWAGRGSINAVSFLMSVAAVTLIVITGDIITRIFIRASEPVTDVQKTLERFSSPYTEYEDPYISDVRQNQSSSSDAGSVRHLQTSSSKSSGSPGNYEKRISEDYEKIKKTISKNLKENDNTGTGKGSSDRTVQVKKLLNGKNAEKESSQTSSTGIVISTVIGIICIIISLGGTGVFDSTDYGSDWEDLGENIVISENTDDSDDYTIAIRGTALRNESQDLLDAINDLRWDSSLEPLEWNCDEDYYLTMRAAELSLAYSSIRPCGEEGTEDIIGRADDISQLIDDITNDKDQFKKITSDDIYSVCAGIFMSDNGQTYYALRFYDYVSDTEMYAENEEGIFRLPVNDEYMRYEVYIYDEEMEAVSENKLEEGRSYIYSIYAVNPSDGNKEELREIYGVSEDTDIADIYSTGTLDTYTSGETDITVKPHEDSDIEFRIHIVVN